MRSHCTHISGQPRHSHQWAAEALTSVGSRGTHISGVGDLAEMILGSISDGGGLGWVGWWVGSGCGSGWVWCWLGSVGALVWVWWHQRMLNQSSDFCGVCLLSDGEAFARGVRSVRNFFTRFYV